MPPDGTSNLSAKIGSVNRRSTASRYLAASSDASTMTHRIWAWHDRRRVAVGAAPVPMKTGGVVYDIAEHRLRQRVARRVQNDVRPPMAAPRSVGADGTSAVAMVRGFAPTASAQPPGFKDSSK
jgi:hypothetical protein